MEMLAGVDILGNAHQIEPVHLLNRDPPEDGGQRHAGKSARAAIAAEVSTGLGQTKNSRIRIALTA